jgi:hypothetical protein
MITDGDPGDVLPDGDDRACALVSADHRERCEHVPGDRVIVGMADTGRGDPDEDLSRLWLWLAEIDVLDFQASQRCQSTGA